MNKIFLIAIAAGSLFSYSGNQFTGHLLKVQKANFQTVSTIDKQDSVGSRFSVFLKKFKQLHLGELNTLGTLFNNEYFLSEDLMVLSTQDKSFFLSNSAGYMSYFGFKTTLPNGRVLLTLRTHYHAKKRKGCSNSDSTFFECFIFNNLGSKEFSFRSFGTNLGAEPPTYNLASKFFIKGDNLIVNHFEYSTGNNYDSAQPINGTDSVYNANLKESVSNYSLNDFFGKTSVRKSRTIQVVESMTYPSIVILKPIPSLY